MKLYVTNLNPDITGEDLKDVFRLAGSVLSARISTNAEDKTRRAGFVEMATPEAGQKAIQQFDGGLLDGATMFVREAAERHKRSANQR